MTEDELREYAADVILDGVTDLDDLSVHEQAEDLPNGFITDEDARRVLKLIQSATVRVSWPDHEYVYGNGFEDDEDEEGDGED